MLRREFLLTVAGTALHERAHSQGPSPLRPNIIFILADDLGYGDLGCYGQRQIDTPNLDRLAADGMRFTDAYGGSAVCAPSRCSFLTGLHTGHCRIRENRSIRGERVSLLPQDLTVAEVLSAAGYRTGAIGKWGVGEACTTGTPNKKGFGEWLGFLNQDHALAYYPTHLWRNEKEWFPKGNQGMKREDYVQDLFL
ncbi:MAG: sulfatase-like hydrolase/transferase, partial [Bryobacterales bacterium]|nr:sulfatase-like hydrolase/transferase [Bryobacterales bacterium]